MYICAMQASLPATSYNVNILKSWDILMQCRNPCGHPQWPLKTFLHIPSYSHPLPFYKAMSWGEGNDRRIFKELLSMAIFSHFSKQTNKQAIKHNSSCFCSFVDVYITELKHVANMIARYGNDLNKDCSWKVRRGFLKLEKVVSRMLNENHIPCK